MGHTRRPQDKAYRQVSLYSSEVPGFREFTGERQLVNFRENEQILEVELYDGTTELLCGNFTPVTIYYGFTNGNTVWIGCAEKPDILPIVTARIWLRKDTDEVAYKVPVGLKKEGTRCTFQIPAGTSNVELFGDKYFQQVFELIRNG